MNLNEQAELLFNEINNRLADIKALEDRERTISTLEHGLLIKSKNLTKQTEELSAEKDRLTKEREFIDQSLIKIEENKIIEGRIEGKRALLREEIKELETSKETRAREESQLKERQKKYEGLEARETELKRREALIIKSEEVDKLRKQELDLKAQAIQDEAGRLQKIADKYQLRA